MDTGEGISTQNGQPIPPPEKSSAWKAIREWVQVIVIALIISLPIRFFVAEPFVVNGASMAPTFATGQFLIVDRLTYRFEAPKRDDVIVFEYPDDPSIYYIKRIIGLPNESVDIADGKVTITPAPGSASTTPFQLDEPYVAPEHASHDDFHIVLGPTQYFVMGDNRAESSDSRVRGPLDQSLIVGRPILRLLPPNEISVLPGAFSQHGE